MRWLIILACAGCLDGIDPVWQLDHDRIVVVRATPPHVGPGEMSVFDALVAHKGEPTDVELPSAATAVKPPGDLFTAVTDNNGSWGVVGPDPAALDLARTQLGLDPGAPVPLRVVMAFPQATGGPLIAEKIVWLGDSAANPALGAVTVAGQPPGTSIAVPADTDVPLAIDVDPTWSVSWLTSCGTMHDDGEHSAFVHVLPADRQRGELAVVERDTAGGVAWQVWPIAVE